MTDAMHIAATPPIVPLDDRVFRALIDAASDPLLVSDPATGRVLAANDAACAAFGYTHEQMVRLSAADLATSPEGYDWATRAAQIERAGELRFESRFRRAGGGVFLAEMTVRHVRVDGRAYFIGTARDVSERKAIEAALRASEERFRTLVRQLRVGVLVQGPKAEILVSNPHACELLGVTEDQLLGRSSFDPTWNVVHEDGSPFTADTQPVPVAIATKRPQRNVLMGVYRPRTRDRAWLLVDAEPQLDPHGDVETVICTFSDVTALKEAERALRASEARLREAQRIARVGSFEIHKGSDALNWSEEMFRISGTDPATFVPRVSTLGTLQPVEERARAMAMLEGALVTDARAFEWEAHLIRPDGETRNVYVRGEALRDEDGAWIGVRGTVQDITDRKRAEQALEESEARFRHAQKMEAIGRLAGGIAHDFNNMLSPILSYASMLQEDVLPSSRMREPLDEIRKAAERAAALTRQLLTFSRQQVVQRRSVDVNAVVTNLERMLRRVLGDDVEMTTRLAPSLDRVFVDPGQLEQVVVNLAVNARDAMPKGGRLVIETANVRVAPEHTEDGGDGPRPFVQLSISDTGSGMDEATRERLFEPFFTTKEPGRGTGLGLATVYGIVKQCRGDIRVRTELGRGTTFDIFLPRYDAAPSGAEAPPPSTRASGGTETVLVVEDEPMVRRLVCAVLRREGYTVHEASTALDAVRLLEESAAPIQLLVTDVVMPGMGGRELAERVQRRHPDVRVVFMSGYARELVVADEGLDASVAFVQKPFSPSELARKVREALDGHGGVTKIAR